MAVEAGLSLFEADGTGTWSVDFKLILMLLSIIKYFLKIL